MRSFIIIFLCLALFDSASAEIKTMVVKYNDGDTELQGYLAYDDANTNNRPAVLIIHEWWGLNDYIRKRAEQIAALGYVAFAADMYGDGKATTKMEEASQLAASFYKDLTMARRRANAALTQLLSNPNVDKEKVAAIGYCFGGAMSLELARSGADIDGVVAFHASLHPQGTGDADKIKAELLIQIGADDKFVPEEERKTFMDEMTKAKVNWQINTYSGTVHSFTNPAAGSDPSRGIAYNEEADKRSWNSMMDFFKEIFK